MHTIVLIGASAATEEERASPCGRRCGSNNHLNLRFLRQPLLCQFLLRLGCILSCSRLFLLGLCCLLRLRASNRRRCSPLCGCSDLLGQRLLCWLLRCLLPASSTRGTCSSCL